LPPPQLLQARESRRRDCPRAPLRTLLAAAERVDAASRLASRLRRAAAVDSDPRAAGVRGGRARAGGAPRGGRASPRLTLASRRLGRAPVRAHAGSALSVASSSKIARTVAG